jgi:16S rRNA (adenine1518-N6/adenine1519-N6)-dimethyltransferase
VTVRAVRDVLVRHGLATRRDLGQNFLVDERLAEKLADRAGVEPGDDVVEIGTGLGILTRALARRAGRVVTLEVDAGVVRALRAERSLPDNVELLHADALRVDLGGLLPPGARARVVANLPYAIASPLLRRLLGLRERLLGWAVMVQREVADRLCAAPGTRAYGSLTVLHLLTVRVQRVLELHPRCFYPVPRVASSFLRMTPLAAPLLESDELPRVEAFVRAAFGHRRKTLVNALRASDPAAPAARWEALARILDALGIDARSRAEALAPERLLASARRLQAGQPAGAG